MQKEMFNYKLLLSNRIKVAKKVNEIYLKDGLSSNRYYHIDSKILKVYFTSLSVVYILLLFIEVSSRRE